MSQYAPPPVPQQPDWTLKTSALAEHGAPTPPAFLPPHPPPASSPSWQGIRLPTTPCSNQPSYYHHPYSPYSRLPHRPPAYNHMGEEEFRRQRHILSPQPRYPNSSPGGFQPSPRLELDLRQQSSSAQGFWSPQPGRSSFTSPPPGSLHGTFHSPPPTSQFTSSQGTTLPPKFIAKQSPSVTPALAGLHPNHQQSQLSASLTGTSQAGLLSIQTSTLAPSSTTGRADVKRECGESSPTSTTASVQDPATSSSDDPQKPGEEKVSVEEEDKDDGCHSTAASPPHVSTTRVSPGNQDNSSTSATDTPTSVSPEDDKRDHSEDLHHHDPGADPPANGEPEDLPMETDDLAQNGVEHAQASQSQEEATDPTRAQCDSAQEPSRKSSDNERPLSGACHLVMDVESAGGGTGIDPVTPASLSSPTPTSQESAQALLSLSQQSLPQPSETNLTAALRLEEKIAEEAFRRAAGYLHAVTSSHTSMPNTMPFSAQATVTRPPGLGPAPVGISPLSASFPTAFGRPPGVSGFPNQQLSGSGSAPYQCPICGFSSTSKFHFNSHMNTHTDHQCTMCDYTARTEGRLKRHMEGHSDEEKMRAGVNHLGEPLKTPAGPRSSDSSNDSHGTPDRTGNNGNGDEASNQSVEPSPLERLQMQLEDTTPTSITASIAGTPRSDEGSSTPRRSTSSSKPKNYKCKQCEHISRSKEESWRHARVHIKPDKLLTCPQCEFVTEYKHHLEYHLRNHFGSKPFQCQKCHYSCVNKSMLNSHMKSHSQFYQFRCSDCTYATKYCHSLKLHLRKYNHRPATVITPDGQQIDPTQNLDLYGNRARARNNRQHHRESSSPSFGSPTNSLHGDNAQGSPANSMLGNTMLGSPGVSAPTMVTAFDALQFQQQHQGSPANSMLGNTMLGSPGVSAPTMVTAFDALQFQQQHQAQSAMANSIATLGARLPTIPTIAASLQMQMKQALIQRQQELQAQQHLKCVHCEYRATTKDDLDKHSLSHLPANNLLAGGHLASLYEAIQARAALVGAAAAPVSDGASTEHSPPAESPADIGDGSAASSGSPISKGSGDEGSGTGTGSTSDKGGSSRRKGKARKLDSIARRLQECRSVEQPAVDDPDHAPKAPSAPLTHQFTPNEPTHKDMDWDHAFICRHCRMAFMHEVMYQIHMGFHGYDNPFRCNRCGHDSPDEVTHFMHIAQSKH